MTSKKWKELWQILGGLKHFLINSRTGNSAEGAYDGVTIRPDRILAADSSVDRARDKCFRIPGFEFGLSLWSFNDQPNRLNTRSHY